jgi:uncharacterized membrane protein
MAYCVQCGNQVSGEDVYCARCGSRQPAAAGSSIASDRLSGMSPRTASILCYIPVVGWIGSLIVLASERFRDDRQVRFHAFQGLYLFVAWLLVDQVIAPMTRMMPGPFQLHGLLRAVILGTWIFMIVKASQGRTYSLPIVGELAERSVAER